MQTIVIGIDAEAPSRVALDWVVERTAIVPADVRLVTVLGDHPFDAKRAERDIARAAQRMSSARPTLSTTTRLLNGAGISDVLAEDARDADLLVVGHHRKRVLRSVLTGALPAQIAGRAHCPVAIVPHDWLRRFGKVVVGVEWDGSSDAALEFAAREADATGRSLDIVHITDSEDKPGSSLLTGKPDDPAQRSPEMAAAVESARAGRGNLAVRTYSAAGDPDRILRAHGRDAALVVVGSHGGGAIDAVLRGARAFTFMNGSKAPLVIVPAGWRAHSREGSAA